MSPLATRVVRAVTLSASRTTGARNSCGTSLSGTCVNSATSGSARNVRTTPVESARSAVNPVRVLATRRESEAQVLEDPAAAVRADLRDERVGSGRVGARAPDRADLVADRRLGPAREPDRPDTTGGDSAVGDVGEAGVGRAERDLGDDVGDVRLVADGVVAQDPAQPQAPQHQTGVVADRDPGGADRQAAPA